MGLGALAPTPPMRSVIKSLHSIKAYNGNGIMPFTVNYATGFGHMSEPNCVWLHEGRTERLRSRGKGPRVRGLPPRDHFGGAFVVGTSTGHVCSHTRHGKPDRP